jgi:hypothetical protein
MTGLLGGIFNLATRLQAEKPAKRRQSRVEMAALAECHRFFIVRFRIPKT